MKKYLFAVFVLSLVIFTIFLYSVEEDKIELLENSVVSVGTITKFQSNMGAHYICYEYNVDNEKIEACVPINSKFCNDEFIGVNDLRIKYAMENHYVSVVIDKRFK